MEMLDKVRRVDIYNWMIIVLAVLTVTGIYAFSAANLTSAISNAVLQVAATIVVGIVLDMLIIRAKEKTWRLSKSAIITGFFVGTIFAPLPNLAVPIAGVIIAIVQKHILRFKNRPLFNPASFGLVAAGLLFVADHAWWSAAMLPAVIIFGLFIVVVFGRLHMVVPYLLTYWILSAAMLVATGGNLAFIQNLFLDGTMLFFTFLMLIEPRTSPANKRGRVTYSVLAGILAAVFFSLNVPYFVPLNLLVANVFARPLENFFRPKPKATPVVSGTPPEPAQVPA